MIMGDHMKREIKDLIAEVAREQFPNADVQAVHVKEDWDADGDPIYRVAIVFKSAHGLERLKTSSFVRHLAPRFEEQQDDHFPVVSFMTEADARKVLAAA